MTRWRTAPLGLLLAALALGCGSSGGYSPTTTQQPPGGALNGLFTIKTLSVDNKRIDGAGQYQFSVGAEHGDLRLTSPCAALYGSFSVLADHRAGVTIAGGTSYDCDREDAEIHATVLGLLGRVERWRTEGEGFVFEAPNGDWVELAP